MSVSQSIRALLLAPDDSPPAPTKNRAPSLLSDERGATMVMGVFMAAMLVGMIYYVWGIGGMVVHRERLQDAADTAVFGAAVVNARGMNLIALMNVIMLVLAIIGTAFLIAKEIVMWTAIIATAECISKIPCCGFPTFCCIEVCIDAGEHWLDYDDISGDSDDWNDRIETAIGAINTAANGIRRGAPIAAQGLVWTYGSTVYRPTTRGGLADIIPGYTTLAIEDDPTTYACGDESFYGLSGGPRNGLLPPDDTPTWFGGSVMILAGVLSAAATDVDAHYAGGLIVGGYLGWYDHYDEYCDGDPDSFMRVPEDDWLGEDPFQVRAGMQGDPPFVWTVEGVAVANWGRTEGTESILAAIPPDIANSVAIAQAEYYWEDDEGDVKQEWVFEPRWRARLRRTTLRGMGGPLGFLINPIATVLDPVLIH